MNAESDIGQPLAAGLALPEAASPDDTSSTDAKQGLVDRKPRPTTILELIDYAYGEGGRKVILARKDLLALKVDPATADAEMALLRKAADADPFLSVPPRILFTLAELGAEPPVRRRILELVLAALASHPVFSPQVEHLADPAAEPTLSGRRVSNTAEDTTFLTLGLQSAEEFKLAARERLRVNAVEFGLLAY